MQPEPQHPFVKPKAEESAAQQAAHEEPIRQPAVDGPERRIPPKGGTPAQRRTRLHRKAVLLPEITQLALEGHTGRAIALRFNLSTRMSYEELRALEALLKAQRALSGASAGAASAGIAPNCPAKPEQDETAPE